MRRIYEAAPTDRLTESRKWHLILLIVAAIFKTHSWAAIVPASSDLIGQWNNLALDAIRSQPASPTLAARNLAVIHGAIFDAVNGITREYSSFRFKDEPLPGARSEAAALGAAHEALLKLYPERSAAFDALLSFWLSRLPTSTDWRDGLSYGRAAAQAILAWRENDYSTATVPYIVRTNAGQWQRTPPQFRPPDAPHWPLVTPFAMTNGAQFRPSGPPSLESDRYAADLNQVKELGGRDSQRRTAEQTQIARFWSDFSYTDTPPGHWNRIAQQVARDKHLSLSQEARLFALLNFALADACIVAWDAKYAYNFWRPVTAIQQADRDGNPATVPESDWQPLLVTPPFPEYISGHSIFSGTAARILALVLGTDEVSFTAASDTLPGLVRKYHGFWDAAEEIGWSRIYGGIHFLSADLDGLAAGRALADYVVGNFLQSANSTTLVADSANEARAAKEGP